MKNSLRFILFFFVFFVFSCNSIKNEINPSTKKTNLILEFQGESILMVDGLEEKDLYNYVNFEINHFSKNARIDKEKKSFSTGVPTEVLFKMIEEILKKYPDFEQDDFSDKEFLEINSKIPSISSKDEAKTKKSIIFDYYEIIVSKELEKEVEQYNKINKKARGVGDSYYALNPTERLMVDVYPIAANQVQQAREKAYEYTRLAFNLTEAQRLTTDAKAANAFQHSFWNAAMVKEIAQNTGNKWKGLNRAKLFGTAHEYSATIQGFQDFYEDHSYMDLQNNLVGRTYMYNTVGQTWLGNANNIPNYETIKNHIKNNCSYTYKTRPGSLSVFPMNSNYSVYTLGDLLNAYDYFTPTQSQLVYHVN